MQIEIKGSALGSCPPVPFKTLNEASVAYRAFIEQNGLGSRDAGACYIRDGGKVVAHVSYNGKVWAGKEWDGKAEPLFVPGEMEAVCAS
jgi:hypothetical protein